MHTKIIVIEDNQDRLEAISTELGHIGCKVFGFLNGYMLVEKARAIKPDLIIISRLLRDKNGMQLCKEIKNTGEFSQLPVLMISGKLHYGVAGGIKAEGFVHKPFAPGNELS